MLQCQCHSIYIAATKAGVVQQIGAKNANTRVNIISIHTQVSLAHQCPQVYQESSNIALLIFVHLHLYFLFMLSLYVILYFNQVRGKKPFPTTYFATNPFLR